MSKKLKDTDFMYISARIRCLETKLLTRDRMERMLDARTNEEAVKILSECGYEELEPLTAAGLEASLAKAREDTFRELADFAPVPELVDVFRVKYDYHNIKALMKCAATGQDAARLLIDAGRVSADTIYTAFRTGETDGLPEALAKALTTASDKLSATGDPQLSDFYLDKAYYEELTVMAKASRSQFLQGYVRLMIDAANLKALVRVQRMGKDGAFLKNVLVEGGNASPDQLLEVFEGTASAADVFYGQLAEAAAKGMEAAKGGRMTAFEKVCDNAVNAYLQEAQWVPFGDAVLVSYAAARENEITAARIILTGRLSGVPADSIRERLRDAYV